MALFIHNFLDILIIFILGLVLWQTFDTHIKTLHCLAELGNQIYLHAIQNNVGIYNKSSPEIDLSNITYWTGILKRITKSYIVYYLCYSLDIHYFWDAVDYISLGGIHWFLTAACSNMMYARTYLHLYVRNFTCEHCVCTDVCICFRRHLGSRVRHQQ